MTVHRLSLILEDSFVFLQMKDHGKI